MTKVLVVRHMFINRVGYINRILDVIRDTKSDILIIGGQVIYDIYSSDLIFAATIDALIKLSSTGATLVLAVARDSSPIIQSAIKTYESYTRSRFYNIVATNQYIVLQEYDLGIIVAHSLPRLGGSELRVPADLCDVSEKSPAKVNILITSQPRADIAPYLELNPRGISIQSRFGGTTLKISCVFGFDIPIDSIAPEVLCSPGIVYPENSQQLGFDEPINLSVVAATISAEFRVTEVISRVIMLDCFGGYLVATYKSDMLISYNRRGLEYIVDINNYSQIKFIFVDCSAEFIDRVLSVKYRGATKRGVEIAEKVMAPKIVVQKVNSQEIAARRLVINRIAPNFLQRNVEIGGSGGSSRRYLRYDISRLYLLNYMIFGGGIVSLDLARGSSIKVLIAESGAFGKSTLCNSIAGALYGVAGVDSINRAGADSAELSVAVQSRASVIISNRLSKYREGVNRSATIEIPKETPAAIVGSNTYFDNAAASIDDMLFSSSRAGDQSGNAAAASSIVLHKETDIKECVLDNCGRLSHALITCWYLSGNIDSDIYKLPVQEQIDIYFELFDIKPATIPATIPATTISNHTEAKSSGGLTHSYTHIRATVAELFERVSRELILLDPANIDHYEKLRATMKYCLDSRREFIVGAESLGENAGGNNGVREVADSYAPVDITSRGAKKSAGLYPRDILFLTESAAGNVKETLATEIARSKVYEVSAATYDNLISDCLECAATLSRSIGVDLVEYVRRSDRISQYLDIGRFNTYCGERGLYDLLRKYREVSDLNIDTNAELYSAFMNYVVDVFDSFSTNNRAAVAYIDHIAKYLDILITRRDKMCNIAGVVDITSQIESLLRHLRAISVLSDKVSALRLVIDNSRRSPDSRAETISCAEFVDLVREINAVCRIDVGRTISVLLSDIISRFERLFIDQLDKYSTPNYFDNHENLVGDSCDELCNYYYCLYKQISHNESSAGSIMSDSISHKSRASHVSHVSHVSHLSHKSSASRRGTKDKVKQSSSALVIDDKIIHHISDKVRVVVKLLRLIFDGIKDGSVAFADQVVAHMTNYRFINITLLVFYNTIIHKANTYREAAESNKVIVDIPRYNRLLDSLAELRTAYETAREYKIGKQSARQQRVESARDFVGQFSELLIYISEIVNNYLAAIEIDKVLAISAEIPSGSRWIIRYTIDSRDISTHDTETIVIVNILLRVVLWQLATITLPRFFLIDAEAQLGRVSARTLSKLIALISSPRVGAQFVLIVSPATSRGAFYGAEYIHIKNRHSNTGLESASYIEGASTDTVAASYSAHIEQHFDSVVSGGYRCKICDIEIKTGNVIRHIESKRHTEAIKRHVSH